MLYPVCPTCGALFSNIQLLYQNDIQELCDEFNVSPEILSRGLSRNEEFNRRKKEILDKYTVPTNYCCRPRLMNFCDIVRIVK
jgi:DNA-directed RNA polymerase subunit N (RpoN/RPB10)